MVKRRRKPVAKPQKTPRQDPEIQRFLARVVGSDAWRAEVEDRVVRLTNAERAKHGLPPLKTDECLRRTARQHGADMARRSFFAHQCPSGLGPADRMRANGHPAPGGENIARGQQKPHAVVQAWMGSPGHRANILRPEFRTIGVGVHLGAQGPWWTQNFAY